MGAARTRLLFFAAMAIFVRLGAASPDARSVGATVVINEVEVFVVNVPYSNQTVEQRAAAIATNLLAYKPGSKVAASLSGKIWRVTLDKKLAMTVTEQDAKASGTSAETLAKTLADRWQATLGLPALKLEPSSLRVPVQGRATIRLVGSQARKARLTLAGQKAVGFERTTGLVTVIGLGVGSTSIAVQGTSASTSLPIKVLPYAARLPEKISAEVTGSPATSLTVETAARAALMAAADCEPGVKLTHFQCEPKSLALGDRTVIRARAKFVGPNAFDLSKEVAIDVSNSTTRLGPESELWYSNEPENITVPSELFWAKMEHSKPVRLLYHHRNRTSRPIVVQFFAVNRSAEIAYLRSSVCESDPDLNPTMAGYKAAVQFFEMREKSNSLVLSVPPGSVVPLCTKRLGPAETVSGLARFEVVGDTSSGLEFVGNSVWADNLYLEWRPTTTLAEPYRFLQAGPLSLAGNVEPRLRHVYPTPFKTEPMNFTVGGRFGFVRIGQTPIPSHDQSSELFGNFGVTYTIKGEVNNPGSGPAVVELVFEASAGYSGGVFLVDGDLVTTGMMQSKEETVLKTYRLPPGQSVKLTVVTMPLSGSNYPATLTLRPAGIELGTPIGK